MLDLKEFSSQALNQNAMRSIYGGKDIETCLEDYPDCKDTLKDDGTTVYPADPPCSEPTTECDAHCD